MKNAYTLSLNHLFTTISGIGCCCVLPAAMADVTFDGSLGPGGTLSGPVMEITADQGQLAGNNLFHSFSEFNVDTGQTVNFSGPDNVQNIFGRVTGSNPSLIDGTISSSIPGANLFLMNPNGMMFGPNAQINISGSFHATTSDYVSFGNQERFYADINQNTTLSIAEPSAFGFLDDSVSSITIDGSQINGNDNSTLSFVGGDVTISNGAMISLPDGTVQIASVQSSGEVNTTLNETDFTNFNSYGNTSIDTYSTIDASGSSGGRVVIRGGRLTLDSSTISADTQIYAAQPDPNIDIFTSDSVSIDNFSKISADLKEYADGTPGGVEITTDHLDINNYSTIQAESEFLSFGNAGNIETNVRNISLNNFSKISTSTYSIGNSGNIAINNAEQLDIRQGSALTASADYLYATGTSGNIYVSANQITVSGVENSTDPDLFEFTGIDAGGLRFVSFNDAGSITIKTNDMLLSNNALIRSMAFDSYNSGDINIDSQNLTIERGAAIVSSAISGEAGNIVINNENNIVVAGVSPEIIPLLGSHTQSGIYKNGGNSGEINITTDSIAVTNGALISSKSELSPTDSGNIIINANDVVVSGYSQEIYENELLNGSDTLQALNLARTGITTRTSLQGNVFSGHSSGNLTINSDVITLSDNAILEADSNSQVSPQNMQTAGTISLNAKKISVNKAKLSSNATNTSGGYIVIDGEKSIVIMDSELTASIDNPNSDDNGGNILMNGGIVVINNSSFAATAVQGTGGNISINADKLILTNSNSFDVSSEFSTNGNVKISVGDEFQGNLEDATIHFLDISKMFHNECGNQNRDSLSSLTSNNNEAVIAIDTASQPSSYFLDSIGARTTSINRSENVYVTLLDTINDENITCR